ncbi:L,D-transpeptidase family protein [Ohtaekwangia koreensis]|uniref:L,D-transpeptidase catalytic domain n=1 Tax=Ohtaekwangia koreensis TaxID=688867 RepID=A0A1T5M6M8_9BACT|nr:L,D-transpeptidase family protein [Ohtaekwangia koreensis]SKC83529.1 L,D-transpeptidase catalytic domain [Ohtaekwangia koreensis]
MRVNFLFIAIIIPLAGMALSGCSKTTSQKSSSASEASEVISFVQVHHTTMPTDTADACYAGLKVQLIRGFYEKRREELFWCSHDKLQPAADSLIYFINHARYHGLYPDRYHSGEIQNLKNRLLTPSDFTRMESLLTDAYISIVQHIGSGQTAVATFRTDSLSLSSLEQVSVDGNVIDGISRFEPAHFGYRSLKKAIRLLIDSLPGNQHETVLLHLADIPEQTNKVLQTLEVNLERWRLEHMTGRRYIFINIPAFMLYLVEDDSVIFESKVIVGTPKTPTPEISSRIECLVTYPYWHIPRKIAAEEYLPVIQKDISFITRNHIDVLNKDGTLLNPDSVDWYRFSKNHFPVLLRQREGTENSLGIVKFVFDNPYAIFLHDTNAKKLFNSEVRAFSHGCVRLEKAIELSHYLVTGELNKKSPKIVRYLKEESRHTINLYDPIPIYIRYYTCDFRDNQFHVYKDIYMVDHRMTHKLYSVSLK